MRRLAPGLALLVTLALAAPASAVTVSPKVVGGTTVASAAEVPWQAQVLPSGYLCGGSIRDATHIVTAAHCVTDDDGNLLLGSVIVRAGSLDLHGAGAQSKTVASVHVHPLYDPATFRYDAAILTLPSALTLNADVAPIALAQENSAILSGTPLQVSGWGTTTQYAPNTPNPGSPSSTLLRVTIGIAAGCPSVYGPSFDPTVHLCAGQANADACQGDSGGPLAESFATPANAVLDGIVSAGAGCAWPGYPGIYTRVANPAVRGFLVDPGVAAPANVTGPQLTGTAQAGQKLTCETGGWTGQTRLTRVFTAQINGAPQDITDSRNDTATLDLSSSHVGMTIRCDVRAEGAGGAASAQSNAVGPVTAAASSTTTTTTTVTPDPGAGLDVAAPTARVDLVRCGRKVCVLDLSVVDPAPSQGVKTVEGKVSTAYGTICRTRVKGTKRYKRRPCIKRVTHRLKAVSRGTAKYRIESGTLRPGLHTFSLVAVDAVGHRQAKATKLTRRTRR